VAALKAASAVNYSNAGTVEFLLEPESGEFYFLEMNTRLQVEHPVTEYVTGLDIVKWQLRIAAGETLDFKQDDLGQVGHSIECRIYAEDPANGFLPQTGRIHVLKLPAGKGIRVDAGITAGQQVEAFYDPMLAKLIVHAPTRSEAIKRMLLALKQLVLLGATSNINFLQAVLEQPAFVQGQVDTAWVERELSEWTPAVNAPIEVLIAAALATLDVDSNVLNDDESLDGDQFSPWSRADAFRLGNS
jgi:acetyl/propionyl-CoA carboxylase alpha subunit